MADELYHHGILGQKWGVRRYQNKDGSLTEEGRRRYYNADGSLTAEGKQYFEKGPSKKQKKEYEKLVWKSVKQNMKYQDALGYEDKAAEIFYQMDTVPDGSKRMRELDLQFEELNKQFDASLAKITVENLLDRYSEQEIRWLKNNTTGVYDEFEDRLDEELSRRQKNK